MLNGPSILRTITTSPYTGLNEQPAIPQELVSNYQAITFALWTCILKSKGAMSRLKAKIQN